MDSSTVVSKGRQANTEQRAVNSFLNKIRFMSHCLQASLINVSRNRFSSIPIADHNSRYFPENLQLKEHLNSFQAISIIVTTTKNSISCSTRPFHRQFLLDRQLFQQHVQVLPPHHRPPLLLLLHRRLVLLHTRRARPLPLDFSEEVLSRSPGSTHQRRAASTR